MRRILLGALALSLLGSVAAEAQTRTREQVLQHHMEALKAGDPAALADDYADDAVVVLFDRVFSGKAAVRKMFEGMLAPNSKAFAGIEVNFESLAPDVTLQRFWLNRGAPNERGGADVFVIRGGKIAFHTGINPPK